VKLGLLRQSNTKNKNRVYAYEEYLQILRKGTELEVKALENNACDVLGREES